MAGAGWKVAAGQAAGLTKGLLQENSAGGWYGDRLSGASQAVMPVSHAAPTPLSPLAGTPFFLL